MIITPFREIPRVCRGYFCEKTCQDFPPLIARNRVKVASSRSSPHFLSPIPHLLKLVFLLLVLEVCGVGDIWSLPAGLMLMVVPPLTQLKRLSSLHFRTSRK